VTSPRLPEEEGDDDGVELELEMGEEDLDTMNPDDEGRDEDREAEPELEGEAEDTGDDEDTRAEVVTDGVPGLVERVPTVRVERLVVEGELGRLARDVGTGIELNADERGRSNDPVMRSSLLVLID